MVAFAAVSGDPVLDHLDPHPFWDVLRQSLDVCYTSLLPIINIGAVHQGECLWPTLTLDLIEKYALRCERHRFVGVLSLVPLLPKPGSFLWCNLWVSSQVFWGQTRSDLLAETWFEAFRPELKCSQFVSAMREIRQITVELSRLRHLADKKRDGEISSEECRARAESLLIRLKQLQLFMEKTDDKQNDALSLHDYFTFFARDARRVIQHFLQVYHVSVGNFFGDEDRLESFWTESVNTAGGAGIFCEEPKRGEEGTLMRKIYEEVKGVKVY